MRRKSVLPLDPAVMRDLQVSRSRIMQYEANVQAHKSLEAGPPALASEPEQREQRD
jgi:hypothetical protein